MNNSPFFFLTYTKEQLNFKISNNKSSTFQKTYSFVPLQEENKLP
jgi:hypothetical protein